MKKLHYNVYSNISDSDYIAAQDSLTILERSIENLIKYKGWHMDMPVVNNDGLIIGFRINSDGLYGTLGIAFEDKPKKITFMCIVSKTFDESNVRFHLSKIIAEDVTLDELESKFTDYVSGAIEQYEGWTKQNVIDLGRKVEL